MPLTKCAARGPLAATGRVGGYCWHNAEWLVGDMELPLCGWHLYRWDIPIKKKKIGA